jgi:cyclophilin family peptidyl-prolyl cis-trans isomerase
VTVVDTPWLNGKHVVFGRVMRGMEVVDDVSDMAVDGSDRPTSPVLVGACKAWKEAPKA